MQLNVLIVDDSKIARDYIKSILETVSYIKDIYEASGYEECFSIVDNCRVDLILLDINLEAETTGMDIANVIKEQYPHIAVIFVTGYSEYAIDAFDVNAIHYIVKPFTRAKILAAIAKARSYIREHSSRERIQIKTNSAIYFIDTNDILFIEKIAKKCRIHTARNGILECYQSLSKLELMLPDNFMRAHQSFVINTDKVIGLKPLNATSYEVIFSNTSHVAYLLRAKYDEFYGKIKKLYKLH